MAKEDYIIPQKNILPKKEFIGLTDDDMSIIFDKFEWKEVEIAGEHLDLFKFARAIEQALKEKNANNS